MAQVDPGEVTRLLTAWGAGDASAVDDLMPLVYEELHAIASRCMRDESSGHTLQTTALVHEAYMRLVGSDVGWESRRHFFAIAARTMRRVLVDHARARGRTKRGGADAIRITLPDGLHEEADSDPLDIIALDAALDRLAALDERKARAIELHYFAGLQYPEVARVLGIAEATVHRDVRFAKSWIYDVLDTGSPTDGG